MRRVKPNGISRARRNGGRGNLHLLCMRTRQALAGLRRQPQARDRALIQSTAPIPVGGGRIAEAKKLSSLTPEQARPRTGLALSAQEPQSLDPAVGRLTKPYSSAGICWRVRSGAAAGHSPHQDGRGAL